MKVFCHVSEFVEPDAIEAIKAGDTLSFDVEATDRGPRGRSIVVGAADASREIILNHRVAGLAWNLSRLRFPFLTVWSEGRTLDDPEIPTEFRPIARQGAALLAALLERRQRRLTYEALFLLSCMHSDAPPAVGGALREMLSKDRFGYCYRHVALALGACRLGWQRDLLAKVLYLLGNEAPRTEIHGLCLQILGIALWRCGAALEVLSGGDLALIVARLSHVLRETHLLVKRGGPGWSPRALKDHLELALALLRTRGSEGAERKAILAPWKPTTRLLARVVEDIVYTVAEHGIPIDSRLSLHVEKPPELSKTPDLLYALKLYLTGDDGARAIRIEAVTEDDNEDNGADDA
jgi:hypothetical protein